MPTRKIFYDESGNELECYINTKGFVFLRIGEEGTDDFQRDSIELNHEDVKEFIQVLEELLQEMKS